ncbi:MAG: coproporphyrinogen III oxidase, partial [Planctomycetes bacterium]|nr:coproporphyrinogen III oxidase [Planctomycetota bacterium]
SIGAQSFDPAELRVLDRIHKVADVGKTVAMVRCAGIRSVNLDLIFAIPGQTVAAWRKNLEAATALEPDHLSCYGLTYTKPTPLYHALQRGRVRRVDTDVEAEMYETTIDFLAAAGFEQYEISNFARPGEACRHNLACWHNRPYVGIGPSAAGLVDGTRYKNVPDTAEWARALNEGRSPQIEHEVLETDQAARETMMLGLRLIEGVQRAGFAERFGEDPAVLFSDVIARHVEYGLLLVDDRSIRLSRRGLLLADSVMVDFV